MHIALVVAASHFKYVDLSDSMILNVCVWFVLFSHWAADAVPWNGQRTCQHRWKISSGELC